MTAELKTMIGDAAAVPDKPEATDSQAEGQGQDTRDGQTQVPLAALQAERAKSKKYTEQVASFEEKLQQQDRNWQQRFDALADAIRPQQQKPDFWEDPDAAMNARLRETLAPVGAALAQQRQEFSEMQAIASHGEKTVDEAYRAIESLKRENPQAFASEYQRIMASPHPYGALVQWHTQQKALSEIGTDPEKYKERIKAEVLAELSAGRKPGAVMPSNFAAARNTGNRSGPDWSGPQPLADIFARS